MGTNVQWQEAARNQFGAVIDAQMQLEETVCADRLRNETVQYMISHMVDYMHLDGEGVNADMPPNVKYQSLAHRMQSMMLCSTMPGEIEISALSNVMSCNIEVHGQTQKPLVYGHFDSKVSVKYTEIGLAVGHYEFLRPTTN